MCFNILLLFSCLLILCASDEQPKACKFEITMKQVLYNEGFHRNLTYHLKVKAPENGDRRMFANCAVAIDQKLPAGVFVNPDELQDLHRLGKANIIPRDRFVNVERPAEQSPELGVYVIKQFVEDEVFLWIPVHARYHHARARGGRTRNLFSPPRLFAHCHDAAQAHCDYELPLVPLCNDAPRELCSWTLLPYTMKTGPLYWEVPVGNTDHYYVVAVGTGLIIAVASLYLLATVHEYKMRAKKL